MTITYPRDVPSWFRGMASCEFDLAYMTEDDPTGDGDTLIRDLGPSVWLAQYTTGKMNQLEMRRFKAWIKSLENGNQTFWGFDFYRRYPAAYPNGFAGMTRHGGSPFDGTCALGTIAGDNKTVPLSTLPDSFVFTEGDLLAFDYDNGRRAMHEVMAPVTGNTSGAASVEVRPHVRLGWTNGATVNLATPKAMMRLVPDSAKPSSVTRGTGGTWTFQARQTLQKAA